MPTRTSAKGDTTTIELTGESTVRDTAGLASSLREAAGSASARVAVDLSALGRYDVTVPQLLVALSKTLEAAGREFRIVELDERHPLRASLETIGFHFDHIERTTRPSP
ncbi:MAG TPA: STAS domain-containing protein [Spirochaetales bacterium]|nr:STAS domain-containing protein [Spirochaetales bacterium]